MKNTGINNNYCFLLLDLMGLNKKLSKIPESSQENSMTLYPSLLASIFYFLYILDIHLHLIPFDLSISVHVMYEHTLAHSNI